MKRKKNTAYIYGHRIKFGVNFFPNNLEQTFKLPATAAILDGISAVFITSQPVAINELPLVDIYVNNEEVVNTLEFVSWCIIKTSIVGTTRNVSTNADPYHPTPRPLSGSDEIRVRIHPGPWAGTKFSYLVLHFHYQPKK